MLVDLLPVAVLPAHRLEVELAYKLFSLPPSCPPVLLGSALICMSEEISSDGAPFLHASNSCRKRAEDPRHKNHNINLREIPDPSLWNLSGDNASKIVLQEEVYRGKILDDGKLKVHQWNQTHLLTRRLGFCA